MNDAAATAEAGAAMTPSAPSSAPVPPPSPSPTPLPNSVRWALGIAAIGVLLAAAASTVALNTQQRVKRLEQELVRRQDDSQAQSTEANVLARQAQDAAREASAKVALFDARLAEVTLQRSQVEELIQSLSRSRDENVLSDVEGAVQVALQQSAITGSAEPLVTTLKQVDERLARYNQPRLERVRRAVARDLDRVRAVGVTDVSSLTIRLDEAVRLADELPLLSSPQPQRASTQRDLARPVPAAASRPSDAASAPGPDWLDQVQTAWRDVSGRVWDEVRSLVRVTRIEHPEAVLTSPEQSFFVRENLKLRLLNARLALLSRQFDTAQSDLRDAQSMLSRYFDGSSKRVAAAADLVRQVMAQARQTGVPRPDETLAALTAAGAGR